MSGIDPIPFLHQPVLLQETLELLAPRTGTTLVDATLGAGGHAEALLEATGPDGRLVGIDRDPAALAIATERLQRYGARFVPIRGNHLALRELLADVGITSVDGILFDLGVSSMQLGDPERGFSLRLDGPLDMRMDPDSGPTAAELLARVDEAELREILWRLGEERYARAIARAVVRRRTERPLLRTRELASLVEQALGPARHGQHIHPATRTFQALRIAVNEELAGLEKLVTDAVSLLNRGGRVAVIAFHSLEDRPIKQTLRLLAGACVCPPRLPVCGCGRERHVRVLTGRPIRPSPQEVERNPRARSARLRAAERL